MPAKKRDGEPWLDLAVLPAPPRTDRFVLEPLDEEHAALDYEALMSCRERLRHELQWHGWPPEGFTLGNNRADLRRHREERQRREAFAYTVLAPDRGRCFGCVYLERCDEIAGGQLSFWVVDDALNAEAHLLRDVLSWAHEAFGLRRIVVPLRPHNTRATLERVCARPPRGLPSDPSP